MTRLRLIVACAAILGLGVGARADGPPKEGESAPDLKLPATQVKKVLPDAKEDKLSLADFKGKKNVVLFWYPKAMTKG